MAGGQRLRANLPRHNQQLIKLQVIVAKTARDGGAPREILFNKWPYNVTLEALLLIHHVVGDSERLSHAPGVVNIIQRAAASLHRFWYAVVPSQPALVPELHGEPHDLMPFRAQHGRNGRGIDSTRHGDGDGLGTWHLAVSA